MFTDKDIVQLQQKGINIANAQKQLENFRHGFPFARLENFATISSGIRVFSAEEIANLGKTYELYKSHLSIIRFVPASGAATRMFKDLYEFLARESNDEVDQHPTVVRFLNELRQFAFYSDLSAMVRKAGKNTDRLLASRDATTLVRYTLEDCGLNYGNLPKGLIKFHHYPDHQRTALEEHLAESALYAVSNDGVARIHFTVSPEHIDGFKALLAEKTSFFESLFEVKFHVSFSVQKPSTDTLAGDHRNEPFRDRDGHLVFRPGGHGALLENLNDLDADIIFIKNIDNVVPDRLKSDTIVCKKALGGFLIEKRNQIFDFLTALDSSPEKVLADAEAFIAKELNYTFADGFAETEGTKRIEMVKKVLNRPIRVCGMVRNEGEPGGGPFFVKAADGSVSLQIVETAQIDIDNPTQKELLMRSTHFNPVDIVCATRDYKGNPFDLLMYRDDTAGFISVKSKDGKELKAQELPGLWNGAMAHWNTFFVEVPVSTFNPVKTVLDLLRDTHR